MQVRGESRLYKTLSRLLSKRSDAQIIFVHPILVLLGSSSHKSLPSTQLRTLDTLLQSRSSIARHVLQLLSLLSLESEQNLQQLILLNTQFRFNNSFDFLESFIQINLLRSLRNQLK